MKTRYRHKQLLTGMLAVFLIFGINNYAFGQEAFSIDFSESEPNQVITAPENVSISQVDISSASISYGSFGNTFDGTPHAQGSSGWMATTNPLEAKNFYFTITADPGYEFDLTDVSSLVRSTGAGPSDMALVIASDLIETIPTPDSVTPILSVSGSNMSDYNSITSITVKIVGYDGGSRTSSGGGAARIGEIQGQLTVRELPPPPAPSNLTATNVRPTTFTLEWDDVPEADDYQLQVSEQSNFGTTIPGFGNLTVEGTSQIVTGLEPGTTYYARVRGENTGGFGSYSLTLEQETLSPLVFFDFIGAGDFVSPKSFPDNATTSDFGISGGSITTEEENEEDWEAIGGSGIPVLDARGTNYWDAIDAETARFLFFTVTTDENYAINLNNISFDYRRSGAGPQNLTIEINNEVIETLIGVDELSVLSFSENLELNPELQELTEITVRIKGWNGGGGILNVNDVRLDGEIFETPNFSVSEETLSGFEYTETAGPSASQFFTLSGSVLDPEDAEVTITAPDAYEVSLNDTDFFDELSMNASGGSLSETIHVRLKAGLAAGSYNGQELFINGGGASEEFVTLNGIVSAFELTEIVSYPINPIPETDNGDLSAESVANIGASNLELTGSGINFGDDQPGSWNGPLPYAQGNAGWTATDALSAKNFFFTITPDENFAITISHIEFEERATAAGPSAFSLIINDEVVFTDNVPDSDTRAQGISVNNVVNSTDPVEIKLAGWDNGSRSTGGGGQWRINDIRIYGTVSSSSDVYNVEITGTEGWRFITSPVENSRYSDLFSNIWTQGFANANDDRQSSDPNVLRLTDTVEEGNQIYERIDDLDDVILPGSSVAVYVYDTNPADSETDGFPKILNVSGFEHQGTIEVSTLIEGNEMFSILGNPFSSAITFSGLERTNIGGVVYVYDHEYDGPFSSPDEDAGAGGGFRAWNGSAGSLSGGFIAPFQGFFVQNTAASPSISIPQSAKTNEEPDFYNIPEPDPVVQVAARMNERYVGDVWLSFTEQGSLSENIYDASMLYPLDFKPFLSVFLQVQDKALNIKNLPLDLEGIVEYPLGIYGWKPAENAEVPHFVPMSGQVEMIWPTFESVPDDWEIHLRDHVTGDIIDIRSSDGYNFYMDASKSSETLDYKLGLTKGDLSNKSQSRFTLIVSAETASSSPTEGELPREVALNQNYPNPFNPTTQISYDLPESADVRLEVYNVQGQRVATLVNAQQSAGTHIATFDASRLASGVYLYRLTAGNTVMTRKMMLVK